MITKQLQRLFLRYALHWYAGALMLHFLPLQQPFRSGSGTSQAFSWMVWFIAIQMQVHRRTWGSLHLIIYATSSRIYCRILQGKLTSSISGFGVTLRISMPKTVRRWRIGHNSGDYRDWSVLLFLSGILLGGWCRHLPHHHLIGLLKRICLHLRHLVVVADLPHQQIEPSRTFCMAQDWALDEEFTAQHVKQQAKTQIPISSCGLDLNPRRLWWRL